jgi:hypothetical protein
VLFLFWKLSLFSQWPVVLLSTTALLWSLQRLLWVFLTDSVLATRNSITAPCLSSHHWPTPLWRATAVVWIFLQLCP